MSSPDPLAEILVNCRLAMQAIEQAQGMIENCIADIETNYAVNGPCPSPADIAGNQALQQKPPRDAA